MKAIICTAYGSPDVLQLKEMEKPVPKDNEIVIRMRSVSVNFGDVMVRNFNKVSPRQFSMPYLFWLMTRMVLGIRKLRPKILGSEFAGEIDSMGSRVTRFNVGDPVFGYLSINMGAEAEYLCMSEKGVVAVKPDNMSYEEISAVPYGALTALVLLRKAGVSRGDNVLINGASGGIGSAAVQLAKHYGATVTGVCGTRRLELVKKLGADSVIDYTKEDFTANGETYDLIMDILGKASFARCKGALKPTGRLLYASFKMKQIFQMLWTKLKGGKRVICALAPEKPEDLLTVKGLVEGGHFKSVIDRTFPLEQAAEAHRYVESGQRTGSVVITVDHGA